MYSIKHDHIYSFPRMQFTIKNTSSNPILPYSGISGMQQYSE